MTQKNFLMIMDFLLFKTYNNNSNSTKSRTATYSNASGIGTIDAYSTNLVTVSEDNRRKSVLISKQLIDLAAKTDTFPNRVGFYIIDSPTEIQDFLSVLLFKGYTVPLSTNVASTVYNNSNIRVSPGEIVGVIPNLVNNSNSVMAGVKLLANDWDHVHVTDQTTGNFKPCVFDATTTVDQGGEAGNTCATTQMSYNRLIKNASNVFPAEAAAPICLVQLEEGDSTRWVSQNEFRKKQGLTLLDKTVSVTVQAEIPTLISHLTHMNVLPVFYQVQTRLHSQKSILKKLTMKQW
jgi:hypothetical protein